jgi:TolB-like protein
MRKAIIVVAVVALSGAALADGKKKLAVREFKAQGVDRSTASILESQLCTELLNTGKVDVVCPDDLKAMMEFKKSEIAFGKCEGDEVACVEQVGKLANAERVLNGEIGKLDDQVILSVSLVDVASQKTLARRSESASDASGLLKKLPDLAKKLTE